MKQKCQPSCAGKLEWTGQLDAIGTFATRPGPSDWLKTRRCQHRERRKAVNPSATKPSRAVNACCVFLRSCFKNFTRLAAGAEGPGPQGSWRSHGSTAGAADDFVHNWTIVMLPMTCDGKSQQTVGHCHLGPW